MPVPFSPHLVELIARYHFAGSPIKTAAAERRWERLPKHEQGYYRARAEWLIRDMGGEPELIAFCEAVLAARAAPS